MIEKGLADEKVSEGWIRAWLAFQVLAVNQDVTDKSLEELLKRLENDGRVKIYKKQLSDIKEVEKPLKNVEKGYSRTADIELIVKNLDDMVQIVIEFGPSAIEILEPKNLKVDLPQAQSILNIIAQVMHQFAAAGIGGVVFIRPDQQK